MDLLDSPAARRAGAGGHPVRDIGGCTVGLVGYGHIAETVETMVSAMGAPHVTWYTVDTMRRYLQLAVDNCRRTAGRSGIGQCRERYERYRRSQPTG